MKVSIGGVLKEVAAIKVAIGSTWKAVANTKAVVGGVWKAGETFTGGSGGGGDGGGFTLGISPASAYGYSNTSPVTSESVTVTPTGGVAPFTYAWTKLSGSGSINSPTTATTTFNANVPDGDSLIGNYRCTATDAIGSFATADCDVEFFNF